MTMLILLVCGAVVFVAFMRFCFTLDKTPTAEPIPVKSDEQVVAEFLGPTPKVTPVYSTAEPPTSFRGLFWGMTLEHFMSGRPARIVKGPEDDDPELECVIEGDDLTFEGIRLQEIRYCFVSNVFSGVEMTLDWSDPDNYYRLINTLVKKYGQYYIIKDKGGDMDTYMWAWQDPNSCRFEFSNWVVSMHNSGLFGDLMSNWSTELVARNPLGTP
jgi:hypothetical protein